MEDKCFCHLNGYAVKDATARAAIESMGLVIDELIATITALEATVESLQLKYDVMESEAIMTYETEVVPIN